MQTSPANKKTSIITSVAKCKCPRCRQGNMFTNSNPYARGFMKMPEVCEVCGQSFDIEVGFYYGSSYVSYGLCIAISSATFIAWWLIFGLSITDNRVFYWLGFNAALLLALQPVLMRVARSGWLAIFVRYNGNWKNEEAKAPERMIEKFKNAW